MNNMRIKSMVKEGLLGTMSMKLRREDDSKNVNYRLAWAVQK
jgi:hypothetical protein